MIRLHEVEEAIKELESSSATYNNCEKLASLYIVREELRKKEGQFEYSYGGRPYYPYYERGGNNNSSYGYRREPMYYHDEDLMIKKDNMMP